MTRQPLSMGRLALRVAALGMITSGMVGATCSMPTETKTYITECTIADDQLKTVVARWQVTPVPLAFRTSHFSQAERDALVRAAKTWNEFYEEAKGFALLDAEAGRTTSIDVGDPCTSSAILSGNQFVGEVKIYKRTSNWDYDDGIIALTTVCSGPDSGSSLRRSFNAILESNHKHFYVTNIKPDLESIFLHEFGHLVGLDHSCKGGSTQVGVPDCNALPADHPYRLASLFPSFKFSNGVGEKKRDLRDNDMGRAACLYE